MNCLTKIGVGIAFWFLFCRLLNSQGTLALIDAGVFAVGLYMVMKHRSRWWMVLMMSNWLIPFMLRIHTVTATGRVWDTLYAICWMCGVCGMWQQTKSAAATHCG